MSSLDLPFNLSGLDRFIPKAASNVSWVQRAREKCTMNIVEALRSALSDLGLSKSKVGFDHPGLSRYLEFPHLQALDSYGPLLFVRQEKTAEELQLIRQVLQINQRAIHKTIKAWDHGMTWKELNYAYYKATVEVGGIIDDPRGMYIRKPPRR